MVKSGPDNAFARLPDSTDVLCLVLLRLTIENEKHHWISRAILAHLPNECLGIDRTIQPDAHNVFDIERIG